MKIIKKLIATILTLALLLCGAALAEGTEAAGAAVNCAIEDGSYVIRIADESGDLGWIADDMAQDDSVVELDGEWLVDGEFVVRYDPTGDGEVTVGVRHYTGIACDVMYTWDLTVRDGEVVEATGGSYTASPDPAESDPYLIGEWQSSDGVAGMTIEKNPGGRAWDVEIASPLTHGAYVFKATIYYDCELHSFVYDKGKYWDVPITDSDEAPELGEAKIAGTTGNFTFTGDPENLVLEWYDDQARGETVAFERAAGPEAAGSVIRSVNDAVDLNDGAYPVAFDRANLSDGALRDVRIFTVDCFDVVDIARMSVGDTIVVGEESIPIETLEEDEYGDKIVNGGYEEGGCTLRAYDEDNCWMSVGDDDFHSYTERAVETLTLSEDVVFTDGWDIEQDPVTAAGIEAATKAILESENDAFDNYNTEIRLEDGRVVEIIRRYVP